MARVETDIVELNILGQAMESMRRALRSYAAVSEEERIAEAITRAACVLIGKGIDPQSACQMALVTPLTDDPDMRDTLNAAVNTYF